jgi:tetratricopeptide (TPR) repeat protein
VLQLVATRINDPAWLAKVGHDLFAQGNYQEAAIFLSAANSQNPTSKNAEYALAAIALQLGLPEDKALSFDPQQGYRVATPAFVSSVKTFQEKNLLPVDGVAGSATLQKLFDGKNFYAAFAERAKLNTPP